MSFLVPKVGLEPTHGRPYWILSPARLPIPPLRHIDFLNGTRNIIANYGEKINRKLNVLLIIKNKII